MRPRQQDRNMGVSPMCTTAILAVVPVAGESTGETPLVHTAGTAVLRCRRGLTLVEMMAALAISTLLAVATLSVVQSMLRSESIVRAASPWLGLDAPLRDMLRRDLAQAREYQVAAQRVTFRLTASLEPNLDQGHLPASIVYEVRRVQDRNWLVRVQRPEVQGAPLGELVAEGVSGIQFEPVIPLKKENGFVNPDPGDRPEEFPAEGQSPREASRAAAAEEDAAPPAPAVGGWLDMPDAMVVIVAFDDGRTLSFVARKGGGL